ncbi:MAG: hypothetical protein ACTHM1_02305 [Solirubrobacteraceae bacterium]
MEGPGVELCFGLFPTSKTPARLAYRRSSDFAVESPYSSGPDFVPL